MDVQDLFWVISEILVLDSLYSYGIGHLKCTSQMILASVLAPVLGTG